jgi:hypothetical protein
VLEEDLDGDGAVKAGVGGFINFAHAACANRGSNEVWAEPRAKGQRHGWLISVCADSIGKTPATTPGNALKTGASLHMLRVTP